MGRMICAICAGMIIGGECAKCNNRCPATKEVRLTDDDLRALLRLIDSVSCKPSGAVLRRKLATALNVETHVTGPGK